MLRVLVAVVVFHLLVAFLSLVVKCLLKGCYIVGAVSLVKCHCNFVI